MFQIVVSIMLFVIALGVPPLALVILPLLFMWTRYSMRRRRDMNEYLAEQAQFKVLKSW